MSELRLLDGDPGLSLPATFSASSSIDESFLLMASRIMLIVFSRLRRLVDGDVRVVPSDDCRRWWWRLKDGVPSAPGDPGTGEEGDDGEPIARSFSLVGVSTRPGESLAMRSGDSATPTSGEVGAVEPSTGEATTPPPKTSSAALPSSPDDAAAATAAKSSGSMRSGGRCSLSMSDLRASV